MLIFIGAPLHDDWVLQDIGVTSGATIKCSLKTVEKPKLLIYLGYNKEVLKITEDLNPITVSVLYSISMLLTCIVAYFVYTNRNGISYIIIIAVFLIFE